MSVSAALHFATMKSWKIFVACVVLAPLLTGCGGAPENVPEVPNVLLITVDTLRADHLGCYGGDVSTPNLDRLSAAGVRFTQARTHIPITGPSHSSIFTSLLPMEHGVLNNGNELRNDVPILAEAMRAGGRRTAAVISLGVMQPKFGYDRGFDRYGATFSRDWMKTAGEVTDEALAEADDGGDGPFFYWFHYSDPHEPYAPPGLHYPEMEVRFAGEELGRIDAGGRGHSFDLEVPPGVSELEIAPLEREPDRVYRFPKFVVRKAEVDIEPVDGWLDSANGEVSLRDSALPATARLVNTSVDPVTATLFLTCKQVLSRDEVRGRYALEVEYADREIGRLLAGLEARGLMENTLVVLTADHGEGLGDHQLVGHISQLYDSLLSVPLIFSWPGELPQGSVVEYPVGLVDLFPTIAELVGAEGPATTSGVSLAPLLRGGDGPRRPFVAATYRPQSPHDMRGVLFEGRKYIHAWSADRDWEELYDVLADPTELADLAASDPDDVTRLRDLLERELAGMAQHAPIQGEISEDDEANLRALGYLN